MEGRILRERIRWKRVVLVAAYALFYAGGAVFVMRTSPAGLTYADVAAGLCFSIAGWLVVSLFWKRTGAWGALLSLLVLCIFAEGGLRGSLPWWPWRVLLWLMLAGEICAVTDYP
jgi:hypothetical protein